MAIAIGSAGSSTFTTWKRRVSAASFSKYFLYSAQVVAAMVRSSPRASAGFSRLAASPWPGRAAGADQRVRLVDEQDDRLRRGLHLVDHAAQPVLEFALHAGARLQQAEIERAQRDTLQRRRHVAGREPQREAFHDRGLADTGLAGEDRIVLPPPRQDVDDLADFGIAAEDRIDLPRSRLRRQVGGELVERTRTTRRHRCAIGRRASGRLLTLPPAPPPPRRCWR